MVSVLKASDVDAQEYIKHMLLAMTQLFGSATWSGSEAIKSATWNVLDEALDHFYTKGVSLDTMREAINAAGWEDNDITIIEGKVCLI
jgi:hypothetical protein